MVRSRVLRLAAVAALAVHLTATSAAAQRLAPTAENFEWLGNRLGISREVPKPWTPVVLNGSDVSVWGRTIRFEGNLLPAQIVNQGVEMFASPLAAAVTVGHSPVVFDKADLRVESKRDDQVVLKTTARRDRLELAAVTTIEFDGMIRIKLTLTPSRPTPIAAYRVILSLKKDVAKVYGRHLEYDMKAMRTDKMSLAACMQYIADKPIHTAFNPEIWLGNRQVGIAFAAETNVQWDVADEQQALSVIPGDKTVELIAAIVDHPITLDAPKTIEFALFPNPLKPTDTRLRRIRLAAGGRIYRAFAAGVDRNLYDYYSISGITGESSPIYVSLPWSRHDGGYRAYRDKMKQNNVKYIPYGALMYANAFHPAARSFYEKWYVEPAGQRALGNWLKYDAGESEDLGVKAGGHWDGYRVCAADPSYADFFVWMYCDALEKEDFDGIYLDHGEVSHSCRNVNHPHYEGATGKDHKFYYGIFAARELLKRLWIAAKQRKPDLLIMQHQSHAMKCMDSFMDVVITGEAMNVIFANSPSSAAVLKNPGTYVPDYDKIPTVMFDYDYLESLGFQNRILPQVKYLIEDYWKQHPVEYKFYSAKLFRYTLLRGIEQWAGAMDQDALTEAWLAMDKIGRLDAAVVFHPYWGNQDTVSAKLPTTQVSYYQRPDRVLLLIGNTGKKDVQETITLKLGRRFARASDAVTGQPVEMKGNAVSLTVPADLYRAVLLSR